MHSNQIALHEDIYFNIFSYLDGAQLIQTIPFVSKLFKQFSCHETFWNFHRKVSRQSVQKSLAFTVKYANQIAMRNLTLDSLDYQNISQAAPFAQQELISDFISRVINQRNQPQTKSVTTIAYDFVVHSFDRLWNQREFAEKQAVDMKNAMSKKPEVLQFRPPKFNDKPLQIGILQGQACIEHGSYLSSILHSLLYIDSIRKQFERLIDLPKHPIAQAGDYQEQLDEYKKKLEIAEEKIAIQQEILQFIYASKYNHSSEPSKFLNDEELKLFLLTHPSLSDLRKVICHSKLSIGFKDDRELDPFLVISLLVRNFLFDCKLKRQGHTATQEFPGYEFVSSEETIQILSLPLYNDPNKQSLEQMIYATIGKHVERIRGEVQRTFDPKEGIIIDQNKAIFCQSKGAKQVSEYTAWYRFKNLPSVLILHIERRTDQGWLNLPVFLPKEGTIDLSMYYDPAEGESLPPAIYRIKSSISFAQDFDWYFDSYVEKDGKYYDCGEKFREGYQEITKNQFLEDTNAYLLVLEKVDA